jgi:excisionase family DNA binding protein
MVIVEEATPLAGTPEPMSGEGLLLLSVEAATTRLGIPTETMYQLINSGGIGHLELGRRRYVSREQLTAFIDAPSRVGPEADPSAEHDGFEARVAQQRPAALLT